jgi:hypothetical protein
MAGIQRTVGVCVGETLEMFEFQVFPEVICTEKIDGTNAQVFVVNAAGATLTLEGDGQPKGKVDPPEPEQLQRWA